MARGEIMTDMLVEQIMSSGSGGNDGEGNKPAVLSCGGIYIPRTKKHSVSIHRLLTMPKKDEPVRIFSIGMQKNLLHGILQKESMN